MESRSQSRHSKKKAKNSPHNEQQQKKAPKTGFFIVIGALIALIAAGGGYIGYTKYQAAQALKANQAVVKKFVAELEKQKFTDLDQLVSAKKANNSDYAVKDIVTKYENIFAGISAENITVSKEKVNKTASGSYTFSYTLSMSTALGELKNLNYKGSLSEEDGQVRIKWAPNLIFPGMSGADKVSITVEAPTRGEITDRNGTGLAVNQEFQQIGVVPNQLGTGDEKTANINAIAAKYDLTADAINTALSQSWVQEDYFVPLKTLGLDETAADLPAGVSTQTVTQRYYPLKEAAAQLIGYTGAINADDLKNNPDLPSSGTVGKAGLEASLDASLRGQSGGKLLITDSDGNEKQVLQEVAKKDGENVQLTVDSQAQQIAYDELDSQAGASVVMDPTNGDLLVAASSPSYDPNLMANGITQEEYDAYNNNELHPFTSRFTNRYAPGSTFKTVTAAIGIDAGTLDPAEQLTISGLKWQKDDSWGSYQVTRVSDAQSQVDLKTALVYSDNIYIAQQTLKMGATTFLAGLDKFIFGEKLDLPLAMNAAQISNDGKLATDTLLADTGYGQGELLLSPIQQAVMYSVFPNGGTLVYPRIVSSEETKTKKAVISENAAATITTDMQAVVSDANGTAHSLASLGIASLAAKTGTAEIKEKQDEDGQENSFLFAFDAEKKNYVLVNMLEDKAEGQSATNHSQALLTYLNSRGETN